MKPQISFKFPITKRSSYILLFAFLLPTLFVLFQNFKKANQPALCRAYFSNGFEIDSESLSLGRVVKKSECLKLAVAAIKSEAAECRADRAGVHVMLGGDALVAGSKTSDLIHDNFVAEFQCDSLKFKSLDDQESSAQEDLDQGRVLQISEKANTAATQERRQVQLDAQARFENLLNSNSSNVNEENSTITIDGNLKFCPGCYTQVRRRIVEDQRESCHELYLVERVYQDNAAPNELIVASSHQPEYHCFNKRGDSQ